MTTLQHADRNIGPAAYNHLAEDELLVTSIFYTLQGEGPYAGCPAVFLRLAGCNRGQKADMGCMFCDTQFHFDRGTVLKFYDILARMNELAPPCRPILTVITGGEPMMQDNLAAFIAYHRLGRPGCSIQIESNGDRMAPGLPNSGYCQIVISPKVTKSGYLRPKDHILKAAMCFKFVISADPESPYFTVPDWALEGRRERVYVSPLTVYKRAVIPGETVSLWNVSLVDHLLTRLNYKRAAALAMEHGLRMSTQQHLMYEVE